MTGRTIHESARDVPVIAEADVVVVGGGTAGVPAAVAAARQGADVLLIERYGYFGGAASGGLVITLPADRQGAYTQEIEQRLIERGGARTMPERPAFWSVWDPEQLKWLELVMLEEAGVRMLCHTMAVGVMVDDDAISGLIVESKAGRGAVLARVIVDCTGDADIAAFAGAPWAKGDDNGQMLPVTMMFMMQGVDEERFQNEKPADNPPRGMGAVPTMLHPGEVNIWGGSMEGIDGTDPWDQTRCENELRKQVVEWVDWCREHRPGCENAFLALTSPQLGLRETRRIIGEHVLTEAEWDAEVAFDDHIGYAYEGKSFPYRSLVPKRIDNLVVAGRCVSTDHKIQGPMRIIPPCIVTGHAAGEAAALAVSSGVVPRDVNVSELQSRLKAQGVPFPEVETVAD